MESDPFRNPIACRRDFCNTSHMSSIPLLTFSFPLPNKSIFTEVLLKHSPFGDFKLQKPSCVAKGGEVTYTVPPAGGRRGSKHSLPALVLNPSFIFYFSFVGTGCCRLVPKSCPTLLQPHGLQPTRLLCPWDFPGKHTGVGCHFLLQGIFPTKGSNILYH